MGHYQDVADAEAREEEKIGSGGRFLDSSDKKSTPTEEAPGLGPPDDEERVDDLQALGNQGSKHYKGLEVFKNPGVREVTISGDEITAICPVTGQPDMYYLELTYFPEKVCLESKALKLYLQRYREKGAFVEELAVMFRDHFADALGLGKEDVSVGLRQKSRGGLSITAVA